MVINLKDRIARSHMFPAVSTILLTKLHDNTYQKTTGMNICYACICTCTL